MIVEALRRQLEPVVDRARKLALIWTLAIIWALGTAFGLCLLVIRWLWGWQSPLAAVIAAVLVAIATIAAFVRYRLHRPDYHQIARQIEQHHPEIKAMLLAALEQQPRGPGGRLGYLQMQVIMQAIGHAARHDWSAAISHSRLAFAQAVALLSFLGLTAVGLTMARALTRPGKDWGLLSRSYHCTIEPGDASVEQGSSVAILARFQGRIPSQAILVFGPEGLPTWRAMTRDTDDPVFGTLIQQVEQDLTYRVEYEGLSSPTYKITTYSHPELVQANVHIVYPEYAMLPDRDLIDPRQIEVPEGSNLLIDLLVNKPIANARLVDPNGQIVRLEPAQIESIGARWRASITAIHSSQYQLELLDHDGRDNRLKDRFSIKVIRNYRPRIKPIFPGHDLEVSAIQEVPVEAEVLDDFGITSYGLGYGLPGRPQRIVEMPVGKDAQQKLSIQYLFDLEQMDLRPDQMIYYWFWADDIGPDGKVRRTQSPMHFLEVRPFELAFFEGQGMASQQEQQEDGMGMGQDQQLVELQKQIINATWAILQQIGQGAKQDLIEDIHVVRQSQQQASEMATQQAEQSQDDLIKYSLQAAAEQMDQAVDHLQTATVRSPDEQLGLALDAEQAAYQHLLASRPRQARVVQARQMGQSNPNRQMYQRQLQQLQLRFHQDQYQTERLAQPDTRTAEDTQILSRLRELANRQRLLTDRLRDVQASLQQAQDPSQAQQSLRQLSQLRDQQMETIRDIDQIEQQMDQPQNRQRFAQARQGLQQARERVRQSMDELTSGQVAQAINSSTRAQRQIEQIQDQLDQAPASLLAQQVRQLRSQAQQLEQRQGQIAQELAQQLASNRRTLEDTRIYQQIADQLDEQSRQVQQTLQQLRDISDQAEPIEPLAARTLYQALRQASTGRLERTLNLAADLLRRDLIRQAVQVEQQARQAIGELRTQIEQAAEGLLGDRVNALAAARQRLDGLIRQIEDGQMDPNNPQSIQAWLEALRQTELLLQQQDLRDMAAAITQAVTVAAREQGRHGNAPQWDLFSAQIRMQLVQLRTQVGYELARAQGGQELAPIDRDPVPSRYAELVRRYFENLSEGNR
ncbi:MAG: hypothetical protein QHH07_00290 [Sedimentisphaerales bacterium]|nr:hypothetical protein [Sedimentisphaerales bacterium]